MASLDEAACRMRVVTAEMPTAPVSTTRLATAYFKLARAAPEHR